MAEIELTDDQVISALSEIERWAYALPKAKGLVAKFKEAKEGLPKLVADLEGREKVVKANLAELEPAYAKKEAQLRADFNAKQKQLQADFEAKEVRLKEEAGVLNAEVVNLRADVEIITATKSQKITELNEQIAALEKKYADTKKSFEDWKASRGL